MSSFLSRVVVTAAGLPAVLGLVWLGGWWLFGLAAVAALAALHEFALMTRPLRPLVIAGYAGALLTLLGTQLGGIEWGTAGFVSTLALAFLLKGVAVQPVIITEDEYFAFLESQFKVEVADLQASTVDDLLEYVRKNRVDEIIIALPWRAGAHLQAILMKLKSIAAEVKLCPDAVAFELPILGYDQVVGVPMLKVFERPLSGWGTLVKAAEDRVLAALFLLILSPLFLLIMLLIKLDSRGPVLFRQKRYGFNNDEFTVLKFRTMRVGAVDAGTVPQARRRDPRVTRMGIFLRRTSLDELPQFVNVLRGEMSLVGPRPHAVAHNIEYANLIDEYLGRHRVKPGITGWAQVNGLRGETETPDLMRLRVQHDLYYIENWSLLFDLKVIFLTPFVGMINRNAY